MEETSLFERGSQLIGMAEYVYNAMSKARYQVLEDGSYYADVFLCPGVWATGDTVEECRDVLRDVLFEWVLAAYEDRDPMSKRAELAWLASIWYETTDEVD